MSEATEHLRALARRIVDEAVERVPLRAALLAGSAGRGDADFYSDIDSVRTEVSFLTVARVEWHLDQVLDRLEEFDSPLQKVLSGLLESLPLYGEPLIERWRARVRDYPEPLQRAVIERYWNFYPLWYYGESMAARDAELWRLDMLLEAAFNLLGVLAGLNRLYFTRFQLKHVRALIAKMEFAPPRLADRLESLFRLEPDAAATELERLVEETRALVATELPDLELPLPFAPGTRQQAWAIRPDPADAARH
jgi:predicted nucleotidyltransferase